MKLKIFALPIFLDKSLHSLLLSSFIRVYYGDFVNFYFSLNNIPFVYDFLDNSVDIVVGTYARYFMGYFLYVCFISNRYLYVLLPKYKSLIYIYIYF